MPLGLWWTLPDTETADDPLATCAETRAARAARELPAQVELQTNEARPTLAIALADRPDATDSIAFATKDRERLKDNKRDGFVSAVFLEEPRRTPVERFNGVTKAKAEPELGNTVVRLTVCVDRGDRFRAGAFQGTVRIYGPKVSDFDYAVIITEKWPWQVAFATLWYAGLAFIIAAWLTGSLAFDTSKRQDFETRMAVAAGVVFGLAAMAPAFFGTYWNNATWGAEPWTHVSGLATAGFTAALAGLAAAHRLISSTKVEEEQTQEGDADEAQELAARGGRARRPAGSEQHE